MSEVRLVIRESGQDWSGTVHGSDADRAIAALSADPVSLAELEAAVVRFVTPGTPGRWFRNFRPGLDAEPHDAGLVIIDLLGRLVVVDSTYSAPGPTGSIWYCAGPDDPGETEVELSYHLADDWRFVSRSDAWPVIAETRRRERAKHPEQETREVLYGQPLLEFIAREVLAVVSRSPAAADDHSPAMNGAIQPRETDAASAAYGTLRQIHAAWLLTPRDDFRGRCPREVLLERHAHLTRDLQDRGEQWSQQQACPAALAESSAAFRYGGFGTHELVMYYNLVRELLWSAWDRLQARAADRSLSDRLESLPWQDVLTTETLRLAQVRDEWLDAPDPEFHGRTPRSIIHRERLRLPEAVSGAEAMVDPDCPCCQMLRDLPGPVFWHLDACEMDDDFAFDIHHQTYEEWEAEQRKWEESRQRWSAEEEQRRSVAGSDSAVDETDADSPWQTSFAVTPGSGAPVEVPVFSIAAHLSELISHLRAAPDNDGSSPEVQNLIDQLNHDFGNLQELFYASEPFITVALFDPVADRLAETIDDVSRLRPDLAPQCAALVHDVRKLLSGFSSGFEGTEFGPGLPG